MGSWMAVETCRMTSKPQVVSLTHVKMQTKKSSGKNLKTGKLHH
jgi:hypothetical protein